MVTDKSGRLGSYQSRLLLTPGRRTSGNMDMLVLEYQMRQELRDADEHAELERRQWAEPVNEEVESEFLNRVADLEFRHLQQDLTTAAMAAQVVTNRV